LAELSAQQLVHGSGAGLDGLTATQCLVTNHPVSVEGPGAVAGVDDSGVCTAAWW
jgi:hypothetical protein